MLVKVIKLLVTADVVEQGSDFQAKALFKDACPVHFVTEQLTSIISGFWFI